MKLHKEKIKKQEKISANKAIILISIIWVVIAIILILINPFSPTGPILLGVLVLMILFLVIQKILSMIFFKTIKKSLFDKGNYNKFDRAMDTLRNLLRTGPSP